MAPPRDSYETGEGPLQLSRWKDSSLRNYSILSGSYGTYGAEPISIDTMELMAILALAQDPPQRDVVVYTDSSYVLKGCSRHHTSTRRSLRQTNRYLWHLLELAVKAHPYPQVCLAQQGQEPGGPQFNFFDSSSAIAAPHGTSQDREDDPPLAASVAGGQWVPAHLTNATL